MILNGGTFHYTFASTRCIRIDAALKLHEFTTEKSQIFKGPVRNS